MNYNETVEYLFTSMPSFQHVGGDAYKPGLERIEAFCQHLGDPQKDFCVIHVAGTNGKGSVSHMLAAVLQEAGYCVGLFTSPHLKDFRERIRVDGNKISRQSVVNFVGRHRQKMEELQLSFFEMTTALAFSHFARNQVEVAIIETGLGGRLDATNIVTPVLSVITNVALEHQAYLGDTIEKIAGEKAGIIKKRCPVLIGQKSDAYNHVFEERAHMMGSPIFYAEDIFRCTVQESLGLEGQHFTYVREYDDHTFDLDLDLGGNYQRHNLLTVLAAADLLHRETQISISRRAFTNGAKHAAELTSLSGRWQVLCNKPLIVCDTGHNAHGISLVVDQIRTSTFEKLYCVVGFAKDKDLNEILPLLPREAHYIFVKPQNNRTIEAEELRAEAEKHGLKGEVAQSVQQGILRARSLATAEDMIFIGGSNFVVAEI